MPIIRNPFRKQDENARPVTVEQKVNGTTTTPKAVDIKGEKQPAEYKLSGRAQPHCYPPC